MMTIRPSRIPAFPDFHIPTFRHSAGTLECAFPDRSLIGLPRHEGVLMRCSAVRRPVSQESDGGHYV